MSHADIVGLQLSLRAFSRTYRLHFCDHLVADGELGPKTKNAIRPASKDGSKASAEFFLGYPANGLRLPRSNAEWSRLVRRLRHPKARTFTSPAALVRGAARRTSRRRDLKKQAGPLRQRALHVAQTLVGVMEHGGNNMGEMVMRIIRENGGPGPEAWCGDFCSFAYRHAGCKTVSRSWAAARLTGGAHYVSSPLPGDIVYYSFDHVGLVKKVLSGSEILTIEGNTGASGAVSDSSTGGDGVYEKRRPRSLVSHYVRVLR